MSFVELGTEFGDTQEAQVVPEGRYDLTAQSIEYTNTSEKHNIRVIITHDDPPNENTAPIFHYLALPKADDEDEKRKVKMLMTKRFLHWFGVPFEGNGFDMNDIPGCSASKMPVTLENYEGRDQNKLDLPMLPKEGSEGKAKASSSRRRS